MALKIGTLVCLVGTDGYMPPMGVCGEIVGALDCDGDYLVSFPGHPCPHPPTTSWYAYHAWLIPLGERTPPLAIQDEAIA